MLAVRAFVNGCISLARRSAVSFSIAGGCAMDFAFPSVATIATLWEWVRSNFGLWVAVLKDPASVIGSQDLAAPETTLKAAQFAAFCWFISAVANAPWSLAILKVEPSVALLVVGFVLTFLTALIFAATHHIVARIVRGKGSFNAVLVTSLYGMAFYPLVELPNYIVIDREMVVAISDPANEDKLGILLAATSGTRLAIAALAVGTLFVYLVWKFTPVICIVQRVGRIRGVFVAFMTLAVGAMAWSNVQQPIVHGLVQKEPKAGLPSHFSSR
jgi:hypothetical protein